MPLGVGGRRRLQALCDEADLPRLIKPQRVLLLPTWSPDDDGLFGARTKRHSPLLRQAPRSMFLQKPVSLHLVGE